MNFCKTSTCNRQAVTRKMCARHYLFWYRQEVKKENPEIRKNSAGKNICLVQNCMTPHDARGLCKKHYMRWHRHGDVNFVKTPRPVKKQRCKKAEKINCSSVKKLPAKLKASQSLANKIAQKHAQSAKKPKCSYPGCYLASRARGLCTSHYGRWRRHGHTKVTAIRKPRDEILGFPGIKKGEKCGIKECEKPAHTKGLCDMHYQREWRLVKINERQKIIKNMLIEEETKKVDDKKTSLDLDSYLSDFEKFAKLPKINLERWKNAVSA